MKTLTVSLGDRSYPITIGSGLLSTSELLRSSVSGKQVLIVTNETVSPLYLNLVADPLRQDYQLDVVTLPDGEQYKTLASIETIYNELMARKHHRDTTVVALGGGVVGDMAGFAAATYQRGVDFVQIPTTLLAQVDSSVGGKTGVNHSLGKNMIGAFYQPRSVMIDVNTLSTLPGREYAAGLAEVIKYGLIGDRSFFCWLEDNMGQLLKRDEATLIRAIETSCQAKAQIVAEDEKEKGRRALLNLGHTFGHAIEAHQGYNQWLHGEAVACGTVIAAVLSQRLGFIPAEDVARIRSLFERIGLPTKAPEGMSAPDFFSRMEVDKKVAAGKIRYILLRAIGEAVIDDTVSSDMVGQAIKECS